MQGGIHKTLTCRETQGEDTAWGDQQGVKERGTC